MAQRIPVVVENYPLPVYAAEDIPSPCLFGLWKPAVYLTPESAGEGAARAHILAHELTHYRHKDHIWSWLRCLALALHWYNPLVWLAVKLSKEDGELACDQGAVERLGEEERIPYGRTLVDLVAQRSARPGDLLSCSTTMTGGKTTIQKRVSLLVKHPRTKKMAALAAVLVLAVSAAVMFAGRGEAAETAYEKLQRQITGLSSFYYYPPPFSSLPSTGVVDSPLVNQARALLAQGQATEHKPQIDAHQAFYPGVHLISSHIDGIENYLIVSGNDGKSYLLTNAAHASFGGEGVREADTFLTMMPEDMESGNYEVAAGYDFDLALELEKLALTQIGLEEPPTLRGELLDQEEIDHFWTSFFQVDNGSGLLNDWSYMTNQFLTSWYDSLQDIDLFELFYNGTRGGEGLTDEEYQLLTGGLDLGWRVILSHGGGYYLDLYYPGGLDDQLMELIQTLPQI